MHNQPESDEIWTQQLHFPILLILHSAHRPLYTHKKKKKSTDMHTDPHSDPIPQHPTHRCRFFKRFYSSPLYELTVPVYMYVCVCVCVYICMLGIYIHVRQPEHRK